MSFPKLFGMSRDIRGRFPKLFGMSQDIRGRFPKLRRRSADLPARSGERSKRRFGTNVPSADHLGTLAAAKITLRFLDSASYWTNTPDVERASSLPPYRSWFTERLAEETRMPPMFDPDLYGSVPTRTPRATLGLARALISAAPEDPEPALAKRIAKIRKTAKLLQGAWVEANRPTPTTEDVRAVDVVLDRRWGAVRSRLQGCIQLDDDDHAPRATKLDATLFPTGLDFLRLPYAEEWAESERRLALIKGDGLETELTALVGAPYLPALKQAHAAYGSALGITGKKPAAPDPARVLEPLRALQAAIASYVRAVVGAVDEDDEDSVAAAQAQLDPIVRARRPRGSGTAENEEPVEAPVPEGPGAAAAAVA